MTDTFLKVDDLGKQYPDRSGRPGPMIFRDVNFSIGKGEFACIIGHSGCGKTTVLNVLAGLEQPSDGAVLRGAPRRNRRGHAAAAPHARRHLSRPAVLPHS